MFIQKLSYILTMVILLVACSPTPTLSPMPSPTSPPLQSSDLDWHIAFSSASQSLTYKCEVPDPNGGEVFIPLLRPQQVRLTATLLTPQLLSIATNLLRQTNAEFVGDLQKNLASSQHTYILIQTDFVGVNDLSGERDLSPQHDILISLEAVEFAPSEETIPLLVSQSNMKTTVEEQSFTASKQIERFIARQPQLIEFSLSNSEVNNAMTDSNGLLTLEIKLEMFPNFINEEAVCIGNGRIQNFSIPLRIMNADAKLMIRNFGDIVSSLSNEEIATIRLNLLTNILPMIASK